MSQGDRGEDMFYRDLVINGDKYQDDPAHTNASMANAGDEGYLVEGSSPYDPTKTRYQVLFNASDFTEGQPTYDDILRDLKDFPEDQVCDDAAASHTFTITQTIANVYGYGFKGWYNVTEGKDVPSISEITVNKSLPQIVLVAKWSFEQCTVQGNVEPNYPVYATGEEDYSGFNVTLNLNDGETSEQSHKFEAVTDKDGIYSFSGVADYISTQKFATATITKDGYDDIVLDNIKIEPFDEKFVIDTTYPVVKTRNIKGQVNPTAYYTDSRSADKLKDFKVFVKDIYGQTFDLDYDNNGNYTGEIPVLLNGNLTISKEGYKDKVVAVEAGAGDLDLGMSNVDQITYNIEFNGNNPEADTAILTGTTATMNNVGYFASAKLSPNGFSIKDKVNGSVCENFEG